MLVPKGGGDFWGIFIVEVLQKTVLLILNFRLGATITLHNVLNELWDGHGTGTASLEAKLLQQLLSMR